MKSVLLRVGMLAVVFIVASQAWAQGEAGGAGSPLTNSSVVKLVRAGFREKTVIAIINVRAVKFDLAPERLIELKKSGVSERIILAMIGRAESVEVVSEDWGDDEGTFSSEGGGLKGQGGGASPGGGVDIFGSSGGSKGRVRSRGNNGGMDNDTQTTGSASVRIIRPSAEAGGAAQSKLERTPTLSNDSVIELVEAGFSEGTIIRRIEQSPVEFDLAPAKLAELRKRRVTETVIAAMRAAMGEESAQPARPER